MLNQIHNFDLLTWRFSLFCFNQKTASQIRFNLVGLEICIRTRNPDFPPYSRPFRGHCETLATPAEFAPAFERARASGKPSIIEVRLDPEAITPTKTLSEIKAGK